MMRGTVGRSFIQRRRRRRGSWLLAVLSALPLSLAAPVRAEAPSTDRAEAIGRSISLLTVTVQNCSDANMREIDRELSVLFRLGGEENQASAVERSVERSERALRKEIGRYGAASWCARHLGAVSEAAALSRGLEASNIKIVATKPDGNERDTNAARRVLRDGPPMFSTVSPARGDWLPYLVYVENLPRAKASKDPIVALVLGRSEVWPPP